MNVSILASMVVLDHGRTRTMNVIILASMELSIMDALEHERYYLG